MIKTKLLRVQSKVLGALWLIVLPVFATAAQQQQDLPSRLTLSQALNIALSKNSIIRTAQSRLDQSTGLTAQSRSLLLPQLEAAAHQSYLTINLIGLGISIPTVPQGKSDPFSSMDARVRLSQDLLNIANLESWRSSRFRQESSRLLVNNARETVVLNVVAAYLAALRAKASRDALTEQAKLANDLYQLTQDRVKQGVSAALEANRASQQVNTVQQQLQESEQSYISARLNLANTLQARITADFEVDDTEAYGLETTIDQNAALQAALATRPDYRAAEKSMKAAELQVQSAKAAKGDVPRELSETEKAEIQSFGAES
jgi:outer membrane protein TolC